ncbi:MAG: hypothetical protein O0X93_08980 [Methanocorpusculum sp.]|uniref:Archaeal Type IV pilin N-terminal domain-containing protein n=1 Tax=Methanocorpusculum petauri TaxID=3002863 RepID=A0ABT4IFU9_9EURY|nr:hypothetical protein [Methanocorpusculum petauri]MCZ0860608.1 hypothetical protein [Methanocorpusculum petauri]MCZ9312005.1 hypothetical protein [Methanocorpusculum sp.]MDE2523272.1 hypothetical protein [Methanocorpusculum sp.]MDE2523981.1 hypothetical protein [Methanocorpusculum sp.]
MTDKHASFTPAMGVVLVIVVIAALVGVGLFVMTNIMDEVQSSRNVQMNIVLSGNDIIATVLPSSEASSLRIITIYVDGADTTPESFRTREVSVGVPIVYEGIASGVIGTRFVMIKGTFSDGRDAILKNVRIQFS